MSDYLALSLKRKLKSILQTNHSSLKGLLKGAMESFADGVYTASLITTETKSSHDYDRIMEEFQSGLDIQFTVQSVHEYYEKFLQVLEDIGGPMEHIVSILREQASKGQAKGQFTMRFTSK